MSHMNMTQFKSDEIYKMTLEARGQSDKSAFVTLLVTDPRLSRQEIYVASVAGTEKDTKGFKVLMQDGKIGRAYRAEGNVSETGHINLRLMTHPKKSMYDEYETKIDDITHNLFISKASKPRLRERQEWQIEEDKRVKGGQSPRMLPNDLAELVLAWDGNYKEQIYKVLNDRYGTPMHPDWKDYIVDVLVDEGYYYPLRVYSFGEETELQAGLLRLNEKQLETIITEGLANYELDWAIAEDDTVQPVLQSITSLDSYLTNFAGELGRIIQENIEVRFDPEKHIHHPSFRDVNLNANLKGITGYFPPQADTIMGSAKTLVDENYIGIIGEMGVGKTPVGAGTPYITQAMLSEKKYMSKNHKGEMIEHVNGHSTRKKAAIKRLIEEGILIPITEEGKEVAGAGINSKAVKRAFKRFVRFENNLELYKEYFEDAILPIRENKIEPYRAVLYSPSIVVEKWKREVMERIPNCEVYEIKHYTDIIEIMNKNSYWENGKRKFRKPTKIEYYVMNSDLPSYTYPLEPIKDWRTASIDLTQRLFDEAPNERMRPVARMMPAHDAEGNPVMTSTRLVNRETGKAVTFEYFKKNDDGSFALTPTGEFIEMETAEGVEQIEIGKKERSESYFEAVFNPDNYLEERQRTSLEITDAIDYGQRIRFIKNEVNNRVEGTTDEFYTSSETAFHCPRCGGPLMETKDSFAGTHFFDGRSGGKWLPRIKKDINWVCKNNVETKHLPKEEVKDRSVATQPCGYVLWQPSKEITLNMKGIAASDVKKHISGYRKVSPAWMINKFLPRGFFKFLVADELHEYKSGTSKIAQGFGHLINHTEKQVLLTGTLMGGMAEDVFYLLARLDAKRLQRESIDFKNVSLFMQNYGIFEKKYSDASGQRRQTGSNKKPGVSPHLFPLYLMRNFTFLELADLGYALPPYQEIPILVPMGEDHKEKYDELERQVGNAMRQNSHFGGMSFISTYINAMYQYADAPFNMPRVEAEDHQTGQKIVLARPYNYDKNDFTPSKFNHLKDLIDLELEEDRKCLVYVKYVGDSATTQMDTYLYDRLKAQGYKVGILRSSKSYDGIKMPKNSKGREQWLKDMMAEHDWDVLITNPRLVKVGLDLLMFPSIFYYQMDYSTFDYMQSSRRSWRIKQELPVKVFTLVYEDTIQAKVLEHIALKIDAAMAMQGKFSEEGLRAMADTNDGMTALAKSLLKEGKLDTIDTIHERFQRLNHSYEEMQSAKYEDYEHYEMNPIEGGMARVREIYLSLRSEIEEKVENGTASPADLISFIERMEEMMSSVSKDDVKEMNKGLKKKEKVVEGQYVLDWF